MKRKRSKEGLLEVRLHLLEIGYLTGLLINRLKEDPGDLLCRSLLDGFKDVIVAEGERMSDAPTKEHL